VAQAVATYDQALALIRDQRSTLFPSLTYNGSATPTGTVNAFVSNRYSIGGAASWAPDLFGKLRAGLAQAKYQAGASAADLGNAILAAQAMLATDYEQLRVLDAQRVVQAKAVEAYARALQITINRYNQGVAARLDVRQAESQLHGARADLAEQDRQRDVLQHAIAVLVGENPTQFSIVQTEYEALVPDVPAIVPSALLERRPDIASAERSIYAANANIGIQRSAFFPDMTISANGSSTAGAVSSLLAASTNFWSLGASVAGTLIDFGGRSAKVAEARAAYEGAVGKYRATVLSAFQQVEDNLTAQRQYALEDKERHDQSVAADQAESITFNQYKAGIVAYTDVITAQTTALSARQAAITARSNRQQAAIALIEAIGGGWRDAATKAAITPPPNASAK
ncbi:MAG: efflux transporter outer membrane subunit, partial [Alphaproteobacteria bacterium]|nr:efflux transporter outer membrane subunit [Alphaproteobacteria bacterium]